MGQQPRGGLPGQPEMGVAGQRAGLPAAEGVGTEAPFPGLGLGVGF